MTDDDFKRALLAELRDINTSLKWIALKEQKPYMVEDGLHFDVPCHQCPYNRKDGKTTYVSFTLEEGIVPDDFYFYVCPQCADYDVGDLDLEDEMNADYKPYRTE